jgi:DNA repair exonuclease SbcCD ATPase subunit
MFADIPGLRSIPDVFYYYENVRGVSFIVDLVLLSLAFSELMKFAGKKAKIPGRLAGILGFILGAALTFAVHGAGMRLLQNWLMGLLLALFVGTAVYHLAAPYWGKWRALFFAIFLGTVIFGFAAGAIAGAAVQGWLSLFLLIGIAVIIFALLSGLRGRLLPGAPGAPGAPTPPGIPPGAPPDLGPIVNAINDLRRDIAAHGTTFVSSLERIERGILNIERFIGDLARDLPRVEAFLNSWQSWFPKVNEQLDKIKEEVAKAGGLLDRHLQFLTGWKADWDKFVKSAETALSALNGQLNGIGGQITDIAKNTKTLAEEQARLNELVKKYDGVLTGINDRIGKLPEDLKTAVTGEFQKVVVALGEVKGALGGLSTMQTTLASMLEILRKWEGPAVQDIINKIESARKSIIEKIKELDKNLDATVAAKGATVGDIENSMVILQNGCTGSTQTITDAVKIIDGMKDLGPRMTELIDTFTKYRTDAGAAQGRVTDLEKKVAELEKRLVDAEVEKTRREEEERRRAAAEATSAGAPAAAVELANLDVIDHEVDAQLVVLQDLMKKLGGVMKDLTLPKFDAKQDEATWRMQVQGALNIALSKAKVNIDELKLGEGQIANIKAIIQRARADINQHRLFIGPRLPGEAAKLDEIDQTLKSFEDFQNKLFALFTNISEYLSSQAIAAINIQKTAGEKQVRGKMVRDVLVAEILNIAKAIEYEKVIKARLRKAKKETAERKKAAEKAAPRRPAKKAERPARRRGRAAPEEAEEGGPREPQLGVEPFE